MNRIIIIDSHRAESRISQVIYEALFCRFVVIAHFNNTRNMRLTDIKYGITAKLNQTGWSIKLVAIIKYTLKC